MTSTNSSWMARHSEMFRHSSALNLNSRHLPRYSTSFQDCTTCDKYRISSFKQRVRSLRSSSAELAEQRRSVRLNLVHLICGQVNDLLSDMALELAELITTHLVDDNRQKNKELVFSLYLFLTFLLYSSVCVSDMMI